MYFYGGTFLIDGISNPAKAEGKEMDRNREVMNFNTGWLYSPFDYANAQLKEFDDSGFESVQIPHANTSLTKHKGEGSSFLEQIASYRFVSWYRRHFTLGKEYANKRLVAEFEGVATVADVYVNGSYVGAHKGAYTGFSFDITDYVAFGEDNVIAVRVDSTRQSDVPPEGGDVDYCLFGGIVRNVTLTAYENLHIEDAFVTTPELSAESGHIEAAVTVVNKGGAAEAYVEAVICDADGSEVLRAQSEEKEVNEACEFEIRSEEIKNPHLWDIDDPYLYTVRISVKTRGCTTDTYETKIGLRRFKFQESGLMLNGKAVKLMGINRHEQWPWQGRAVPDKLQARDADMIKETGFNAVRCSHYPQSPAFLKRCDELGLIVFEEAPGWQHIGNGEWQEIYKENIREMILRDRNHPSIFSWGVRVNESDDNDSLYAETNAIAHELDSTRPTHGARRQDTYKNSTFLEDIYTAHYIYPDTPVHTPFIITEHSWDCWSNGYGCPGASDEQALAFAKDFADKVNYYYGNDLCAGGFAWSMFDYNNEVNYTKTGNVFYSGVYDIFRLPKIAANLYISQKEPEKYGANIYIANYWDDDAKPLTVGHVSGDIAQGEATVGGVIEGDSFSVTVMSNCDDVKLYINGVKVDKEPERQYLNLPHPFFVFTNIEYEPGELEAVGCINGEEAVRTLQRTPGKAAKLLLEPDYDTLVADGTDMTPVTLTLVDENGMRLPQADNAVNISLEGAGEFIGEESAVLEGGRTAFIVKTRYLETGEIKCRAQSNGVESAECVINVSRYEEKGIVPISYGKGTAAPIAASTQNGCGRRRI